MDIVAIMGSPRKHGNTDMLLDEMIKGAEEKGHNVKKYYISDLEVHPCMWSLHARKRLCP